MFDASAITRPLVMGILNATPDSFANSGHVATIDDALRMIDDGADLLDIGGESTRPGALCVDAEEELRRVVPLIQAIRQHTALPLSIDTRKAVVAREAIAQGADIINDVSALRFDPAMEDVVRGSDASIILMHSRGTPETMEELIAYNDVVTEVRDELLVPYNRLRDAGISAQRILLDPGCGFAKSSEDSITLLINLQVLADLAPVVVGISRKRFTGGLDEVSMRLARYAVEQGAKIIRTHNVGLTRHFLDAM